MRRRPIQREKGEQAAIVHLLTTLGASVYILGTRRSSGRACPHCRQWVPNHDMSTRQTPGIPDLFVLLPNGPRTKKIPLWIEVKAGTGKPSADQRLFAHQCAEADVPHITGGLDAVIAWLVGFGYLKPSQVPHYRLTPVGNNVQTTGATPCRNA